MDDYDDIDYGFEDERYEDDLAEFSDREAWEDERADRYSDEEEEAEDNSDGPEDEAVEAERMAWLQAN